MDNPYRPKPKMQNPYRRGSPSDTTSSVIQPGREGEFEAWVAKNNITDLDNPESHYDYRGAFNAGENRDPTNQHFTDTFKQPGHPSYGVTPAQRETAGAVFQGASTTGENPDQPTDLGSPYVATAKDWAQKADQKVRQTTGGLMASADRVMENPYREAGQYAKQLVGSAADQAVMIGGGMAGAADFAARNMAGAPPEEALGQARSDVLPGAHRALEGITARVGAPQGVGQEAVRMLGPQMMGGLAKGVAGSLERAAIARQTAKDLPAIEHSLTYADKADEAERLSATETQYPLAVHKQDEFQQLLQQRQNDLERQANEVATRANNPSEMGMVGRQFDEHLAATRAEAARRAPTRQQFPEAAAALERRYPPPKPGQQSMETNPYRAKPGQQPGDLSLQNTMLDELGYDHQRADLQNMRYEPPPPPETDWMAKMAKQRADRGLGRQGRSVAGGLVGLSGASIGGTAGYASEPDASPGRKAFNAVAGAAAGGLTGYAIGRSLAGHPIEPMGLNKPSPQATVERAYEALVEGAQNDVDEATLRKLMDDYSTAHMAAQKANRSNQITDLVGDKTYQEPIPEKNDVTLRLPRWKYKDEKGAAGRKTLSTIGLLGAGAGLSQSDNPELKATGHGILALTLLHGIGSKRMGAAGSAAGSKLVEEMRASPTGTKLINAINPDALLTPEVLQAIKQAETSAQGGTARALELGGKARARGGAVDRHISDLIEGENFEHSDLSPADQEYALAVAAEITDAFNLQGRAKVAQGLLKPETVAKTEGHYLPRKYAYFEAQDALAKRPGGTAASLRSIRTGSEHMRQDLAPDIRNLLGEIREASYRTEEGLTKGAKDIASAELWKTLQALPDVIHPDYLRAAHALADARAAGDMAAAAQATQEVTRISREFMPTRKGEWVRLPDSRGLGPLRGVVVRREIANSISGLPEMGRLGGPLMNYWKRVHTVYNPGTHLANFFSNVSLAHMGGLNSWEQPAALMRAQGDLGRYGPTTKILAEAGVLDANAATVTSQGAPTLGASHRLRLRSLEGSTRPETRMGLEAQGLRPMGPVETALRKADRWVTRKYNNEDNVFRVALYDKAVKPIDQGGLGMSQAQAVAHVKYHLLEFRTRSPLLNWTRNWVSPFILWSAKALPVVAKTIVDHPWRWLTLAATWGSLDQYSQSKVGRIPDKDLPLGMKRTGAGYILPGMTQLPWKNKSGDKAALDVSRFTPVSALTTGGPPGATGSQVSRDFPRIVMPSGPLVDIFARLAANTDPFSGEKFIGPADTWKDVLKKSTIGDFDAGKFTPGAAATMALPSGLAFHTPRIINDLNNANPQAAKVDALGVAGLRPQMIRPGEQRQHERFEFQQAIGTLREETRRDIRRAKSHEAKQAIVGRMRERLSAIFDRYGYPMAQPDTAQ